MRAAMSNMEAINYQANRLEDFNRRAAFSPQSVYRHQKHGWAYIPVHDFADETSTPVYGVDCWCLLGDDAALLECHIYDGSGLAPGFYARIDGEESFWPKLHVVLVEPLTRTVVEDAMTAFVNFGFPERLMLVLRPGDKLMRVTENDVGDPYCQ
jgi:hypothetical protein